VVPRVAQQQGDAGDAAIALLERDPSLKRLDVSNARLGLDPDRPALAVEGRVPRSSVLDRELSGDRDLEPPPDRWPRYVPKPTEEGELGCVPDGLASWIRPRAEVQPHHGKELRRSDDR
jgi:hypothetical protein